MTTLANSHEGLCARCDAQEVILSRRKPKLSAEVVRLIISARCVAYDGALQDADDDGLLVELEKALEAFASAVPWDDQPENQHNG